MKYKPPKIVLDTNIFINGLFSSEEDNEYIKIMNMVDNKQIYLLFSQDTIGELVYVAKNFARHNIIDIKNRILLLQYIMESFYYSTSVNTINTITPEINDKYDDMFLKIVIESDADYLISDDLKSGMHDVDKFGFKVMSAKDFCEMIKDEKVNNEKNEKVKGYVS